MAERTKKVLLNGEEKDSCGYQGYEFGAGYYPDSLCIDGYLHDCDSDYESDEKIPCPNCNKEEYEEYYVNHN